MGDVTPKQRSGVLNIARLFSPIGSDSERESPHFGNQEQKRIKREGKGEREREAEERRGEREADITLMEGKG